MLASTTASTGSDSAMMARIWRMPIRYAPEGAAPDDPSAYTLSDTGELTAIVATFLFTPSSLEGTLDAWMYGREAGVQSLAREVATVGAP